MNEIVYHFPRFVLGGDLNSLRYCFNNNIPLACVYQYPNLPERDNIEEIEELLFFSSCTGRVVIPYEERLQIVVDEEKQLLQTTLHNVHQLKIYYDELIVFNDDNVLGLPPYKRIQNKGSRLVIDWVDLSDRRGKAVTVNHGDINEYGRKMTGFMFEVGLYDSTRAVTAENKKDVFVMSILKEEELFLPEYSEAVVRKEIDEWVVQSNIKGEKRYWRSDKQQAISYYPVYVSHEKRDVVSLEKRIYDDTKNVTFMRDTMTIVLDKGCKNWQNHPLRCYRKFVDER